MLLGCMHLLKQRRLYELLTSDGAHEAQRQKSQACASTLQLIGQPLPDDSVTQTAVVKKNGRTYYQWCKSAFLGSSSRLEPGLLLCCAADVPEATPERNVPRRTCAYLSGACKPCLELQIENVISHAADPQAGRSQGLQEATPLHQRDGGRQPLLPAVGSWQRAAVAQGAGHPAIHTRKLLRAAKGRLTLAGLETGRFDVLASDSLG